MDYKTCEREVGAMALVLLLPAIAIALVRVVHCSMTPWRVSKSKIKTLTFYSAIIFHAPSPEFLGHILIKCLDHCQQLRSQPVCNKPHSSLEKWKDGLLSHQVIAEMLATNPIL